MESYATLTALLVVLTLFYAVRQLILSYAVPTKLNFTTYGTVCTILDPPTELATQLMSRAIPNRRLARAFGISSTFVSSDINVHARFKHLATELIATGKPWAALVCAEEAVETCLPQHSAAGGAEECPFDAFVQAVSLRVVLVQLLGVDPEVLDLDDIHVVTRGINDLWRMSKTQSSLPPNLLIQINARLRSWVPQFPNPIELIIPAFETMWRVVAIAVVKLHEDDRSRKALCAFWEHPSPEQFREWPYEGPSVEAVMLEVLRLYPPTRHISRDAPQEDIPFLSSVPVLRAAFSRSVTHVADIETVQRSEIWGPRADAFDPMRHHPSRSTEEQRQARPLLSFGHGKLRCPAKNWAPHAAAVISAAVLKQVGEDSDVELVTGERLGGREGWDGWFVRRKVREL